MLDGINLAIATALTIATTAGEQTEQADADEQHQCATHSFPTFPV